MPLRVFLITLGRQWTVVAIGVALGLGACFVYQNFTSQPTAESTVAVLDPFASRGTASGEAQIDFSDIVQSRELAERVAATLGMTPNSIKVKVRVLPPPAGAYANASVVYGVSAQAKTEQQAVQIDNVVVDQAMKMYIELNTPNADAYVQAMAPRFQSSQAAIDKAQSDLDAFVSKNSASDLPTQISQQRDLVFQLQLQVNEAIANEAAAGGQSSATIRFTQSLQRSLSAAQGRLDSLSALESQYQALADKVTAAKQVMQGLVQAEQNYMGADRPPYPMEVKVLDSAAIQSQALIIALTYVVGVILGLLAGVTVVYLIAVFHREPQSAVDVGRAMGVPVLVRIPRPVES